MKKIVKPHKARKPSASTDVPSFARGKDQILKNLTRLQRRKKNELGEFDTGKDNFKNIRDAYDYANRNGLNNALIAVGDENIPMDLREYQVTLPNVTVTPLKYASSFDGSYSNLYDTLDAMSGGTIGMAPVLGDVLDIGKVGSDLYNKQYASAAFGAGLLLLPNVLEKTIFRPVAQGVGKWIINRKLNHAIDDIQLPENRIYNTLNNPSHNQIYTPQQQNNTNLYNPFIRKNVDIDINPHVDLHRPAETYPNKTEINLSDQAVQNTQVVRKDGSINFDALRHEINRLSELFPNASDPNKIINNRLIETHTGNINSAENTTISNIYQNLLLHSLRTAKAAQRYPVPEGFTRLLFVLAALFHDIGKVLDKQFHAGQSAVMLRQLGTQKIDDDVYDAIRKHMDDDHMLDLSNLTRALHAVDVNQSMSPEIGFYMNPLLVYPFKYYPAVSYHESGNIREEAKNINKIIKLEGYPKIDINASESEIRRLVQDLSERMNTWMHGIRMPHDRNLFNLLKQTADLIGPNYTDLDLLEIGATHIPLEYTGYGRNDFGSHKRKLLGVNDWEYDTKYVSNSPGTAIEFSKDIGNPDRETRVFKLRKPVSNVEGATEQILRNAPIGIRTQYLGHGRVSPMSVRAAVGREFLGLTGTSLSTAINKEYPIKYTKVPRSFDTIHADGVGDYVNDTLKQINQLGGTFEIPIYSNGDTFKAGDLKKINTVLKSVSDVLESKSKKLDDDFVNFVSEGKSTKFKRLLKVNPQYVLKNQKLRKSLINNYLYNIYKTKYAPKYFVKQLPLPEEVQKVRFAVDKGVVPSYMLPSFHNLKMYILRFPKSVKEIDAATLGYNFDKYGNRVYDLIEDVPINDINNFYLKNDGRDNGYTSRLFTDIFKLSNGAFNSGKDSGIHIKKANRGKFTAAAKRAGMGVQAYARKILNAPKGKYSSTLRKRANFAVQAKKWN